MKVCACVVHDEGCEPRVCDHTSRTLYGVVCIGTDVHLPLRHVDVVTSLELTSLYVKVENTLEPDGVS